MAEQQRYKDPYPTTLPANANRAPAFQFYPDKFLAGTDHLSDGAGWAYMRLLCFMWNHTETQYSMPDTEAAWRRATKIHDPDKMQRIHDEIQADFDPLLKTCDGVTDDGKPMIFSNGLKKEREKQIVRSRMSTIAAYLRHGTKFDPLTLEPQCPDNADAGSRGCTTTPSTSPTTATHKPPKPPPGERSARKRRLSQTEKRRTRVEANTDVMERVGKLFGRRKGTLWTIYESEALKAIGTIHGDDLALLEYWYKIEEDPKDPLYRRKQLDTLLNNWQAELDKSRPIVWRHKKTADRKKDIQKKTDMFDGKEDIVQKFVDDMCDAILGFGIDSSEMSAIESAIHLDHGLDFMVELKDMASMRAKLIKAREAEGDDGKA